MRNNFLYKLSATLTKEWLLMWRDRTGLAFMFLMPVFLVIVVTAIQDGTFKLVEEKNIPLLFVNNDTGEHSLYILEHLRKSKLFSIENTTTAPEGGKKIFQDKYKVVIQIPENYTNNLKNKIQCTLDRINMDIGFTDWGPGHPQPEILIPQTPAIGIAFDPVLPHSYKSAIENAINQMVRAIESRGLILQLYNENDLPEIPASLEESFTSSHNTVEIQTGVQHTLLPSSTQHNVPAWSLFAMFFIVISLASNIIKEKLQGSFIRLRTMPSSFLWVIVGKTMVYLVVCVLQLFCIVLIGIFVFPLLDLPILILPSSITGFLFISFCAALAAISFSIAVGLIANTMEQANGFGAISVIIMAAIGGIWVPTFVMTSSMQFISKLSPMNWALEGYYDLFLREKSLAEVSTFGVLLIGFAVLCYLLSFWNVRKRHII